MWTRTTALCVSEAQGPLQAVPTVELPQGDVWIGSLGQMTGSGVGPSSGLCVLCRPRARSMRRRRSGFVASGSTSG